MKSERYFNICLDGKHCVVDLSTMHVAPFVSYLIAENAAHEFNEGTKDPAGWAWFELKIKPLADNTLSGILAKIGGNHASAKGLFMLGVEFGFRQGERGLNLYAALAESETAWDNAGLPQPVKPIASPGKDTSSPV